MLKAYGQPDATSCGSGDDCVLAYNRGLWFRAKDRTSPINTISVVPAMDYSRMPW